MAGGTFLSQNKIRPGAYLNFTAVPAPKIKVGDRGIVALALPLSWGPEGKLIEVLSTDLLDGSSLKKVGFTAFDKESKLLGASLNYCYKALVYRTNSSGTKASATITGLTVTALYTGTFGNKILVAVNELKDKSGLYEVITYVNGAVVDTQKVMKIEELESNDYVTFSGSGKLTPNAGTALTSGADGTGTESTYYPNFLNALKMAKWQTLACFSTDDEIKQSILAFIKLMRDGNGRYVQAVVSKYDSADTEGVVNSVSSVVINGETFKPEEFVAVVAGMTAGADIITSNTARKIDGATEIVDELTNEEIIEGLKKGQFIISTSSGGDIKVEQDINSLHTFTNEKNYNFSKQRVMRTLDEIGTSICLTWESSYMGKSNNDATGRNLFKTDIIAYGNELQRISAIQDFLGADDITVEQGNDLDAVVASWYVKPVDSMEKLYLDVNVRG